MRKIMRVVHFLRTRGSEGATLAQVVKVVESSVKDCNEYLNALLKLREVTRHKERVVRQQRRACLP